MQLLHSKNCSTIHYLNIFNCPVTSTTKALFIEPLPPDKGEPQAI